MNIFLLFAYGTVVLLCTVLVLSIWVVASNAVYVHIEKKNQIIRNQLRALIDNLLHTNTQPLNKINSLALKNLITRHKQMTCGVLAHIVYSDTGISRRRLINALQDYGLSTIAHQELRNLKALRKQKRLWAAANLPFLAPAEDIIPALSATLTDNDSAVRLAAAQALSTLHAAETAYDIIEKLSTEKTIPWTRIVELMPSLGQEAIPLLIQALQTQTLSADQRAITLASLGMLRATQAEEVLAAHLTDPDKHIRIQAAKALGSLPAKNSTPALLIALVDKEWEVRVVCAHALGNIADPSALTGLFTHLGDPVYWVRYNSADALSKMGTPGIAQLEQGLTSHDPFARDACQLILDRTQHLETTEDGVQAC